MNYAENLQAAGIVYALTMFMMSWDYVPDIFNKIKRG